MGFRNLFRERGFKGSILWFWFGSKGYDQRLARLYYRNDGSMRFFLRAIDFLLMLLEILASMFLVLIGLTLLIVIAGIVPRSLPVAAFTVFLLLIVAMFSPLTFVATGRSISRQIHFKKNIRELWSENAS